MPEPAPEHHSFKNVNEVHKNSMKPLEVAALAITDKVGSMGFFFIILGWTAVWLMWNFFAPEKLKFDPPMAFVFWLFISNMIQILLMPLIMVGQNLQGRHSEIRSENDFKVNVEAEKRVRDIQSRITTLEATLSELTAHVAALAKTK